MNKNGLNGFHSFKKYINTLHGECGNTRAAEESDEICIIRGTLYYGSID